MSYAYSIITCQSAWLSYYYPLEFFVASLTVCSDDTDKVRRFIKSAKERGIKLIPPNINKSDADFTIKDDSIVFGLNAIKGVGASTSKKIMTKRPKTGYLSIGHFMERNKDLVNSKILEFYTKAGCFSEFHNKETILQSMQNMLDWNSVLKSTETLTIFDLCKIKNSDYVDNFIIKNLYIDDKLSYEIDSIGLYIIKNPIEDYIINKDECILVEHIKNYCDGDAIPSVGVVSGIDIIKTKAKTNMARFNLDSDIGSISCICFPRVYSKFIDIIPKLEGKIIYAKGILKVEESGLTFMINDLTEDIRKYAFRKESKQRVELKFKNATFILEK